MPDRERFAEAKNKQADLKKDCVDLLRRYRRSDRRPQSQWLPALLDQVEKLYGRRVSRSTLYNWDKAHVGEGTHVKLVDKRGGDQRSKGDPAAWQFFRENYLDDRSPTAADCWRRTKIYARKNDLKWCGKSSMHEQLDRRIPPEVQLIYRDYDTWRQQVESGIDQNPNAFGAGERWDGDHAQLDFFIRIPGQKGFKRPWITAWIDWRTRRMVGWHISTSPNSTTILLAFRKAMLDESNKGGPNHIFIDNGKDYDSYLFHGQTKAERKKNVSDELHQDETGFRGLYRGLNITPHFSIPYGPNGKSRIERWFGTLHDQFDRTFETYCGHNQLAKPELLDRALSNPSSVPTLQEIIPKIEAYIHAYNARTAHQFEHMGGKVKIDTDKPTCHAEANDALKSGKWPRKIGLILADSERQWDLTLQGDQFTVTSALLPDIEDAQSPREVIEARMAIVRRLGMQLDALYLLFLAGRVSPRWDTTSVRLTKWIKDRK